AATRHRRADPRRHQPPRGQHPGHPRRRFRRGRDRRLLRRLPRELRAPPPDPAPRLLRSARARLRRHPRAHPRPAQPPMNVILRTARATMSILSPLMGERATGRVLVRAAGGPASLPMNSYAVPVVGGQLQLDAMVKTLPAATIDPAGTLVPAASVL